MKKIWTLIASTLLVASVSFAQDDFDSDYADQADEQYTEQEQAEVQADEQQQAAASSEDEAEQPSAAEEPAPSKPVAAPVNNQVQEPAQETAQNDNTQEVAPRHVNRFGFGLKLAFDYGRMYGFTEDLDNDSDISGTPTGIGFEGGLMVCVQMIPNLYFAPEFNIAYISTKHEYLEHERKYNSVDLEIPLLMRGIVAGRFYITGGPQITLSLSSDAEIETIKTELGGGVNLSAETHEKIEQAAFGFGIAAGAGINIVEGLYIDLRYYMGITELYPDVKTLDDMDVAEGDYSLVDMSGARMMKFKVGISYWFI